MTQSPEDMAVALSAEALADVINRARYVPGGLPERGLAEEDAGSQEYARRLARAAYATIQSEVERLTQERDEARLQQKAWADKWDLAISQHVPGGAVKVKLLEWFLSDDSDRWVAQTPFGEHIIVRDHRASAETTHGWFSQGHWYWFGSLESAKAAAQADYEARILSAIAPAPQEVGDRVITDAMVSEALVALIPYWRHAHATRDAARAALTAALTTQVPSGGEE